MTCTNIPVFSKQSRFSGAERDQSHAVSKITFKSINDLFGQFHRLKQLVFLHHDESRA